ncbi:hypothetical protein SALBM311S_09225 [Streptomyces alboniger]
MTTNTNTATSTTPKAPHATPLIPLPPTAARAITVAGSATALVGTFLAWTWTEEFPGNLTVTGYPGGLQILTLVGAILTLLFTLSGQGIRGLNWLTPGGTNSPVRLLTLGVLGTTGYSMGAISDELGGLVNLEPGAWVSGIGSLIAAIGAFGLPADQPYDDNDPTPGLWGRIRHTLAAPEPSRAKDLQLRPRSSSSRPASAPDCTSSPTASAPNTPNCSSASSSSPRSDSPPSPARASSNASPG